MEQTELSLMPHANNDKLTVISEEEKKQYGELTKSLTPNDVNSVINFGTEIQRDLNKYSEAFLDTIKTAKSNEMSTLVNDLLTELEYVDVEEFGTQSKIKQIIAKIPLLKKLITSAEKLIGKYDSISQNIDTIARKIEYTRLSSLKDNTNLQLMFDSNLQYMKDIDALIKAGQYKIEETKKALEILKNEVTEESAYKIEQLQTFITNLEKRLVDLMTMKTVTKQSLAEIRLIQGNNLAIATKAQTLISTTIPAWRNQISIALAIQRQKNNAKCQKMVTDTTNLIIRKNAELLKTNTVEVAKETERAVIDIETLRSSTKDLIETLSEVQRIHEEANIQRQNAIKEMKSLEATLDKALIR